MRPGQSAQSPVRWRPRKFGGKPGSSGEPSGSLTKLNVWSGAMPPSVGSSTTGQMAYRSVSDSGRVRFVIRPLENSLSMSPTVLMIGVPSAARPLRRERSASSFLPSAFMRPEVDRELAVAAGPEQADQVDAADHDAPLARPVPGDQRDVVGLRLLLGRVVDDQNRQQIA
jgi:hypothetical protein